jgi:ADP-ribosylglycohydrolase
LLVGPITKIIGGGNYTNIPGQGGNPTQSGIAIYQTLKKSQVNDFDSKAAADAYLEWDKHSLGFSPQMNGALRKYKETGNWANAGWHQWEHGQFKSAPNSSLARAWALAVYFASDETKVMTAAVEDSALTNFDPKCLMACAVYAMLIARIIREDHHAKTVADLIEMSKADVDTVHGFLSLKYEVGDPDNRSLTMADLVDAADAIHEDLDAALLDNPRLHGEKITNGYPESLDMHETKGYVRVPFRMAMWQMCHANSYEESIIDVVNRGGDSDTNGAIVGGLMGAFYGEAAIPDDWRTLVLEADFTKGYGTQASKPIMNTNYHPRLMFT